MSQSDKQLWKAIHIVGKTFTPKNRDSLQAFICFFDCLSDLLPNENYRMVLKSFISQYPPINYLSSSERSFEWTYKLHSYVNLVKKKQNQQTHDISLERANELYSSITKTDWGNAFWFIIHFISANLPDKLNEQTRTAFIAFIMCIRFLIPCEQCEYHMTKYISETDIIPFMMSGKTAFQWTWTFHNKVSERLGKNTMHFQDAYNMYSLQNSVYSVIDN